MKYDEWCESCKEYDKENHCCPRFNHVIRTTLDDVRKEAYKHGKSKGIKKGLAMAQPKRTEERTKRHACDCISRQAAIDALGEKPLVWDDFSDFDLGKAAQWSDDVDTIKELPSAQPKRIKGRWLKKENVGRWDDTLWECSECGCLHRDNVFCISGDFNFCPNCGADMRGDEE